MTPVSALRLLLLAALWGGSFPLMRVAVPALGPIWLITLRVALAAVFLWVVARALAQPRLERRHLRHHLILGLINSALPFVLFAVAAQTVTASMLAVLNATAPIWGALIGAGWHGTRLRASQLIGLLMGVVGVAWLVGVQSLQLPEGGLAGLLAALAAPVCYGISATYVRGAPGVPAFGNAHGSMWAATFWLLPLAAFTALPPSAAPVAADASRGVVIAGAVLMLGIACSGVAYAAFQAGGRPRARAGAQRHLPDSGVRHLLGRTVPGRSGGSSYRDRHRHHPVRHGPGHWLLMAIPATHESLTDTG